MKQWIKLAVLSLFIVAAASCGGDSNSSGACKPGVVAIPGFTCTTTCQNGSTVTACQNTQPDSGTVCTPGKKSVCYDAWDQSFVGGHCLVNMTCLPNGTWGECDVTRGCATTSGAGGTTGSPQTGGVTTTGGFPATGGSPTGGIPTGGTLNCASGFTACGGVCKNLQTDLANCGACGSVCPYSLCVGGVCCGGGPVGDCNGKCVNVLNDPNNCGSCGHVCTGGKICDGFQCWCPPSLSDCNGICVDIFSDNRNCGPCGHVCPTGTTCSNAACVAASGTGGTSSTGGRSSTGGSPTGGRATGGTAPVCAIGETLCGSTCAYLFSDANNCGACGNVCPSAPHGIIYCLSGTCRIGSCTDGYQDCNGTPDPNGLGMLIDADGCETNLYNNPNHCGSCSTTCPAGTTCSAWSCIPSGGSPSTGGAPGTGGTATGGTPTGGVATGGTLNCSSGLTACGSVCADLQTDVSNCQYCGHICFTGPYGSRSCSGGSCILTCEPGHADCNRNVVDGCEISLPNDVLNCGACGNACPTGASCTNGTCQSPCTSGQTSCSGTCVDLQTNSSNCGACGNACPAGDACTNGACKPTGYAFGACKENAIWFGGLDSAWCGTNLEDGTATTTASLSTITTCISSYPANMAGSVLTMTFDYLASASSCESLPELTVIGITAFTFPSCSVYGTASLTFALPPGQANFDLELYSGPWCASVRVTSITKA